MKRSVDNGGLIAVSAPAKRSHQQISTLVANPCHAPLLLRPPAPRPDAGRRAARLTKPSSVKAKKASGNMRTPSASGTANAPGALATAERFHSPMEIVEDWLQSATSFSAAAQPQPGATGLMSLAKKLLAATLSVPGARPVRRFAGLWAAMNFIEMERLKGTMGAQPAAAVAALSPCGHSSGGGANEVAGPFGVQVQGYNGSLLPTGSTSTPTQHATVHIHAFQAQPSMDGMGMLPPPASPSACWVAAPLPLPPPSHTGAIAAPAPATVLVRNAPPYASLSFAAATTPAAWDVSLPPPPPLPEPASCNAPTVRSLQSPAPLQPSSQPLPPPQLQPSPLPSPSPPPPVQHLQPPSQQLWQQPTPSLSSSSSSALTRPPTSPALVGLEEEQRATNGGLYGMTQPSRLDQEDSAGLLAWLKESNITADSEDDDDEGGYDDAFSDVQSLASLELDVMEIEAEAADGFVMAAATCEAAAADAMYVTAGVAARDYTSASRSSCCNEMVPEPSPVSSPVVSDCNAAAAWCPVERQAKTSSAPAPPDQQSPTQPSQLPPSPAQPASSDLSTTGGLVPASSSCSAAGGDGGWAGAAAGVAQARGADPWCSSAHQVCGGDIDGDALDLPPSGGEQEEPPLAEYLLDPGCLLENAGDLFASLFDGCFSLDVLAWS